MYSLAQQPSSKRKYKAIQLAVLFHIAWRNIASKKLRSFLTVFGVVIGISAIYFLLSFGLGIQQLVTSQVIGDKSLKAIDVTSPNSKILRLDDTAVNTIRQYPHVERLGLQYSFPGSLGFNGGEVDAVVYGINQEYQQLTTLNITNGRLLEENDNTAIVVNKSALKAFGFEGKEDQALNQQVDILIPLQKAEATKDQIRDTFTIVGIIESGAGSEVFMPDHLFTVAGVPAYQQIKIVADHTDSVNALRKQVESSGFQTVSLTDTLSEINKIFKFFNAVLISFGSIGMVVAILGMFNTLTISLLERTREIGLMMALGGRRSDMRKLFIFEAGLISLVGAILGIMVAMGGGQLVNVAMNQNAQHRGVTQTFTLFSNPLWAVIGITLATVVVGLIVVYFPARRAEKINPIDALRRE